MLPTSKKLFSKATNTLKNIVFISDFQQKDKEFQIDNDSLISYNIVRLNPINKNNIFLDSLYISKKQQVI